MNFLVVLVVAWSTEKDRPPSKNNTLLILSRLAGKKWFTELSRDLIEQFYPQVLIRRRKFVQNQNLFLSGQMMTCEVMYQEQKKEIYVI